jgi:hypothetical protein
VRNSPLEEQNDEFLPIFSSVGSDWFRRPDNEPVGLGQEFDHEPSAQAETQIGGIPAIPASGPMPQAMSPAASPVAPPPQPSMPAAPPVAASMGTSDRSGLPQRVPGQSGVSASWSSPADTGFQAAQAASEPAQGGTTASGLPRRVPKANLVPGTASLAEPVTSPAPQISPERLRSRLSSFQQGVRQGRAFTRGEDNEEEQ